LSRILIAVFLMAVVTYIPRVFPIAIFKRKIESRLFKSFLYYIPFAVLGAMTFPSILFSTGNLYFSLAGTIVALALAYYEKGLLKVATSAVLVVYICELIF
jgi:branched-subunit amino acid transport protein